MLEKGYLSLFTRSLLFAGFAATVAACSGGATSQSVLPQQNISPDGSLNSSHARKAMSTATPVQQWANGSAFQPTSIKVSFPKSPAAGHVLVVALWNNGKSGGAANTYTPPSGWTRIDSNTGHTYATYQAFTHVVAAGESNSYIFKPAAAQREHVWIAADVANAGGVDTAKNAYISSGRTWTTPAATPSNSADIALALQLPLTRGVTWTDAPGWTRGMTAAEWNGESLYAQLSSTSAVSESSTSSTAASGYSAIVLLQPTAGSSATVTPTPSAAPSAAPTVAPTVAPTPAATVAPSSSSPYVLDGCHVYTANDWFTTNLATGGSAYATNTVDPHSAQIIANFDLANGNPTFSINGSTVSIASHVIANQATNATPMLPASGFTFVDPTGADRGNAMPWQSSFYGGQFEHTEVLNTQTCVDYETYGTNWSSGNTVFHAANGEVHDLKQPFNSQLQLDGATLTQGGVPLIGTEDLGEDVQQPSINHIAYMMIPPNGNNSLGSGGYVYPASHGTTCVSANGSNCTYKLPLGARLRLNPSRYNCDTNVPAAAYPQAHKVCVQLETYGAIVMDHNGESHLYNIMISEKADGTNPWNESDVSRLNGIPLTDWDVMTLGTIH